MRQRVKVILTAMSTEDNSAADEDDEIKDHTGDARLIFWLAFMSMALILVGITLVMQRLRRKEPPSESA